MNQIIQNALSSEWLSRKDFQECIVSEEFYFKTAQNLFKQIIDFNIDNDGFFSNIQTRISQLYDSKQENENDADSDSESQNENKFITLIKSFEIGSKERTFLELSGKLIAHIDTHAANKKEWNTYNPPRSIATSFIRQNDWLQSILLYKQNIIKDNGCFYTFNYLLNPERYTAILSQAHRIKICKAMFERNWTTEEDFVEEIIKEISNLQIKCKDNATFIASKIFYEDNVRKYWDKMNPITGIVGANNDNGWKDYVCDVFKNGKKTACLWWHRRPKGQDTSLAALRKQIDTNGFFDYYQLSSEGINHYFRVIDFAIENNYKERISTPNLNWSEADGYHENFYDYRENGNNKQTGRANIVFLVDKAIRIDDNLNFSDFEDEKGNPLEQSIRNVLLQPFSVLNKQRESMGTIKSDPTINFTNNPKNIILYGAPGTGKTYDAKRIAVELALTGDCSCNKINSNRESILKDYNQLVGNNRIRMVTFHPSFSYEDFIEGIRPVDCDAGIRYEIGKGVFKKICEDAHDNPDKHYVLIIDEINRGNVAQIFGELITTIEPDKRGGMPEQLSVLLPYSKKMFTVPNNIHLVGTMNTADRSVEALDTALRRRFVFWEIKPEYNLLSKNVENINLQFMLATINRRLHILKDRDHAIGHAYLLKINNISELRNAFSEKIIPLLQEFFFNKFECIQQVLGNAFVKTIEQNVSFCTEVSPYEETVIYEITESNWTADDFISIYEPKGA